MSTEFTTRDEQVVAVRFWGGKDRGVVMQMEVTEREFEAFADMEAHEHGVPVGSFAQVVEEFPGEVVWDSAARRNEMARDMEAWMAERAGTDFEQVRPAVEAQVAQVRQWARAAARDSMRGV